MRGYASTHFGRLRRSETGFALIEVMVSAVLLVALALATLKLIDGSTEASAAQRSRSIASNLAHADLNRMRQMTINAADGLSQTTVQQVAGVKFTIQSTAQWASDKGGVLSCTSGSTGAQYLRMSSSVSWTGIGTHAPVVAETIVTPRVGELDPTMGALTMLVKNASGQPVPGVNVSIGGQSAGTNDAGCAVIPRIAAGTYNASYYKTGYIATDRSSTGIEPNVSIVAGQTSLVQVSYDAPTSVPATFGGSPITTNPTWTSVSVVGGSKPPVTASGAASTTFTVSGLYPFASGYSAYAGKCAGNDPTVYLSNFANSFPAASVPSVPGGSPTPGATAYVRTATVTVANAGTNKTVHVEMKPSSAAASMSGCTEVGYGTATSNSSGGGTASVAMDMPFGVYQVCADAPSGTGSKYKIMATTSPYNSTPTGGTPAPTGTYSVDLGSGTTTGTCPW